MRIPRHNNVLQQLLQDAIIIIGNDFAFSNTIFVICWLYTVKSTKIVYHGKTGIKINKLDGKGSKNLTELN